MSNDSLHYSPTPNSDPLIPFGLVIGYCRYPQCGIDACICETAHVTTILESLGNIDTFSSDVMITLLVLTLEKKMIVNELLVHGSEIGRQFFHLSGMNNQSPTLLFHFPNPRKMPPGHRLKPRRRTRWKTTCARYAFAASLSSHHEARNRRRI